jgi:glycerophosphoryl diester phosphodiesterase
MTTRIVSHRLRGFDVPEATADALRNAIAAGVTACEVDIRLTSDSVPVINHDARLSRLFASTARIADISFEELLRVPYKKKTNSSIMMLEGLLTIIIHSGIAELMLFLDVKETGGETEIIRLLDISGYRANVIIISWLPEVLFRIHKLAPEMKLCFSHYYCPSRTGRLLRRGIARAQGRFRGSFTVLTDEYNNEHAGNDSRGRDYEHILSAPVTGRMFALLQSVGGIVCVQHKMLTREFIATYHSAGIEVLTYSVNDAKLLDKYTNELQCDYILTDNPRFCLRQQ